MDSLDSIVLPLQLRRDRGYVYFPDAIASCIQRFALEPGFMRAECYKISDRQICAEEIEGDIVRSQETFGSIVLKGGRRFVLREQAAANTERYDLIEPAFDFELNSRELVARAGNSFPTLFHRWAVCCKTLYHHSDSGSGKRMLLQRIETFGTEPVEEEIFKLEFMTPERFMKFGIFQNHRRAGEVIAAAREMR